jgi:(p)ppGpp synthase/HD superfamily hydrolase
MVSDTMTTDDDTHKESTLDLDLGSDADTNFHIDSYFASNFDFDSVEKVFPYDVSDLTENGKNGLVFKAALFALDAHEGQFRKYSNEPYIVHPIEVARTVKSVLNDTYAICAALLHDVVEDTPRTNTMIRIIFGDAVADLVHNLTDITEGNRKTRKEKDRDRLSKCCSTTKTIKLADLISNTPSIVANDKNFARVYLREKALILRVVKDGDATLYGVAKNLLKTSNKLLNV